MLQGLVADRIAEPSMHRLHGLPLAVVEERGDILARGLALRTAREVASELVGELAKPSQERPSRDLRHAQKRARHSSFAQVRNLESPGNVGPDKVVLGLMSE
jgi:hypothetical protein